uniref:Uncharacterized protein n=1 Tax=Anguilla anguilla TaxID=7936 RepID=A0A0E9W9K9_ANGAN
MSIKSLESWCSFPSCKFIPSQHVLQKVVWIFYVPEKINLCTDCAVTTAKCHRLSFNSNHILCGLGNCVFSSAFEGTAHITSKIFSPVSITALLN